MGRCTGLVSEGIRKEEMGKKMKENDASVVMC